MSATKFVRETLTNTSSYLLHGTLTDGSKVQFEYRDKISPAILELELLSQGIIRLPRWLVKKLTF